MFDLESLERSFRDVLKINILSLIETGNVFFDTMIKLIVITLLTTFSTKILGILDNFSFHPRGIFHRLYLWWNRPKKVMIVGYRYVNLNYMRSRLDFSMRFNAFLDKIVKSLATRKRNSKLVQKLSELQVRESVEYLDDSRKIDKDFQFIVDQGNYFEIDEHIYCNINIHRSTIDEDKKSFTKEEYMIEIWSDRLDCNGLIKYIEKETDRYEKEQIELNSKNRYIFKFDENSSEKGIQWQVSEFHSKRTLDQVFFENKREVMSFLDRWIKERELYERIGKPWQLGILLEGEPGCGKTSFIVGLANYLGRSIKDCQFNRMKTVDDLEACIHCKTYENKDMSIEKVIMVAEDFDCMTDLAKSRKLADKENELKQNKQKAIQEQMDQMKSDEGKALMYAIGQQQMTDSSLVITPQNPQNRNITLSNLLNILDGIQSMPGRIMIFSTNHSEKLDEAFLRPGRIDLRITLGRPSKVVIYEMLYHWYKCIDEFYPGKRLLEKFKKKWRVYENRIKDGKYRPCDITNILQKSGENIEHVLNELV